MEPATTAKVILHTSKGPIEIELWAKETPLTSRNFIQLCLDGYYDGCKFHRVIKDFIIQSGDPSGSGYGGSSVYENGTFKDEFHSRLRFTRRGLLASANAGSRDSNGSQFIITLAPAPELNNKNTVFGRVVGDTYFNVLKIAETEVDDNDRPLYPAVITKAEVALPYFTDLNASGTPSPNLKSASESGLTSTTAAESTSKTAKKSLKRKSKVKISYGADEDDETEVDNSSFKMKPAHDLLKDKRLKVSNTLTETPDKTVTPETVTTKTTETTEPASEKNDTKPSSIKKLTKKERERATFAMLQKFQAKLSSIGNAPNNPPDGTLEQNKELGSDDELPSDYEEDVDESGADLWKHKFTVN